MRAPLRLVRASSGAAAPAVTATAAGHGDHDLVPVLVILWLGSVARVVAGLVENEVFGTEAVLALLCGVVVPWMVLGPWVGGRWFPGSGGGRRPLVSVALPLVGMRGRRATSVAAVVVTVAVVVGIWSSASEARRRALEKLPADARRELYVRTLQTLQTTCAIEKGPRGIDDYCRGQAEFVLSFPECDAGCRKTAEPYRAEPTR